MFNRKSISPLIAWYQTNANIMRFMLEQAKGRQENGQVGKPDGLDGAAHLDRMSWKWACGSLTQLVFRNTAACCHCHLRISQDMVWICPTPMNSRYDIGHPTSAKPASSKSSQKVTLAERSYMSNSSQLDQSDQSAILENALSATDMQNHGFVGQMRDRTQEAKR